MRVQIDTTLIQNYLTGCIVVEEQLTAFVYSLFKVKQFEIENIYVKMVLKCFLRVSIQYKFGVVFRIDSKYAFALTNS